jgi:RNA polymerase sigma-70 factor, ECF subfamily
MSSPVDAFLVSLPRDLVVTGVFIDASAVAADLERAWTAGRAAWPGVEPEPIALANRLGERVTRAPVHEVLARLHAADLYLACAAGRRDPAAARAFDRRLGPLIEAAARQAGADATLAADVRQQVTIDVLVGDDRGPGICRYGGRGDLRGWLRSVAVRTAWRHLERTRRDAPWTDDGALGTDDDPAVAHLRRRWADELRDALAEALASLGSRQRTLLRLAYVDGLTVDELGRIYQVHRATAARWVAAARDALFDETRLRVEAAVDADLSSVIRLVRSQVHLSLGRLLVSGAPPPATPGPAAPPP